MKILLQLLAATLLLCSGATETSNRRRLKKNGAGRGGGGKITGNSFPEMCDESQGGYEEIDVVIVGAGWSGVMALWKILDFNSRHVGTPISVRVFEKANSSMGRGVAAHWMNGGDGNPIVELFKNYFSGVDNFEDWYQVVQLDVPRSGPTPPMERAYYYNKDGEKYDDDFVNGLRAEFEDPGVGYPCLEAYAEDYIDNAAGGAKDKSFREVLRDECSWPPPTKGDIRDIMEYFRIDYEFGSEAEKMSMWNLPIVNEDDFKNEHWYMNGGPGTFGSSSFIGEKFIEDQELENFIEKNRAVTKIYWDNNDGTDYPVRVRTIESSPHDCYDIKTKKVIYTPSIGVLERRGDCLHVQHAEGGDGTEEGCTPDTANLVMFDPVLPFIKMEAIRNLFIDPSRSEDQAGMAEYKEIRFQFAEKFWQEDGQDKEYIAIETNQRGFNWWQNLDGYGFTDTNSLVATLNTEKWDELSTPEKELLHTDVMDLLNESLGKLNDAPENFKCDKIDPLSWYPGSATTYLDNCADCNCVYSYWPGWTEDQDSEDGIDNWYGSYSIWNVGKNNNGLEADWNDYIEPLDSNGRNVVHISGTGACDRHQEYAHGAYYAGIKSARIVIEELTGILDNTTPEYCGDIGPP